MLDFKMAILLRLAGFYTHSFIFFLLWEDVWEMDLSRKGQGWLVLEITP